MFAYVRTNSGQQNTFLHHHNPQPARYPPYFPYEIEVTPPYPSVQLKKFNIQHCLI